MKSMMKKTTLREIRQSLGRYLAIFSIVALGVGFFAGLKITQDVMLKSANAYFVSEQLYDYRLLSSLGFEEEDVAFFVGKEDVRAAQGAYSADIIYMDQTGNDRVIKAHSLCNDINKTVLIAGEMPQKANECVVDSRLYDESMIGKKICFSENNTSDDLENFSYREYTITGVVKASYYSQFERGTSSLGNGTVSGFMYLLPEGFSMDYYTEIFVKFDEDLMIYSDAYHNYIEEKDVLWEEYCKEAGNRRYQSIVDEAEEELKSSEEEFQTEKLDGEKKLSDAWNELTEGQEKIADGRDSISQAYKQLKAAEEDLKKQEAELNAAKEQMAGNETALFMLAEKEQLLSEAKAQLKANKKELSKQEEELNAQEEELNEGFAEYEDSRQEFDEKIADAEQKLLDARKEIDDIETASTYVLGRDANIGYACFESDATIVDGIANVFPVFFFLVAALICMTTMNRMVEEQRTQIGILKALGYNNAKIMGKYLFYSGSAAISGCLVGYFAGTVFLPAVIYNAYGIMYCFGSMVLQFSAPLLLISLIASALCSMGVTYLTCRNELKEVAASLMRPKSPKAGKRVILEHIPFIWNRMKFLQKVSVRNIFRYKKRFFMMIIGVSGCTALLITGFGVRDSVTNIANKQYQEISVYDLKVSLKDGTDAEFTGTEEIRELTFKYHGETTFALETAMDITKDDQTKSVYLVVPMNPQVIDDFIHIQSNEKEKIPFPEDGYAVITKKLADTMHIEAGDTITLRDEDGRLLPAVVSGICENYIYNYVYMNTATYEKALGEAAYKTAYVKIGTDEDVHEAGAAFMNAENVTSVVVSEDLLLRVSSMMNSMNYIVLVIVICAAALAFIVLYNLNNINITERVREIATIKVLGFYKNETAAYVFNENTVLTFLGALLGILLGKWMHAFVMSRLKIDMISFDTHVAFISYALSICMTFLFMLIVNRFMNRKLNRINMAESLKSVD